MNNHKGKYQLISTYSQVGRMSPKVSANIKKVVLSSEYVKSFQCQSEGLRLLYQNKPHFMRYLDLKTFWAKLVLWIISCISRLIEEMFIQNKKKWTQYKRSNRNINIVFWDSKCGILCRQWRWVYKHKDRQTDGNIEGCNKRKKIIEKKKVALTDLY